jgi:transcriptional regulator with GAF, ATPase, and Fis domain
MTAVPPKSTLARLNSSMSPLLVAISGSLMKDQTFSLHGQELVIGREIGNEIRVPSKSVSRRHCCIRQISGSIKICDLDSLNGTFVNGSPIKEQTLEHGDLIRVGDTYFKFVTHEREAQPAEQEVAFDDDACETCLTIALRCEDAAYLQIAQSPAAAPSDRLTRDLQTLVGFATRMGSVQELSEMQKHVLEMIAESVPVQHGAILLWETSAEEISSRTAWDKSGKSSGTKHPVHVSRTILRRVAQGSAAVLVNDVSADAALCATGSLAYSKVSSILCAPLTWAQKTFGAIYLDTWNPVLRFAEADLQLVMGIAGITAAGIVNLQRVERLRMESKRLQTALDAGQDMVGGSASMRRVFSLISRVAENDSTVLLCGESGTGKELAARAIHRASSRRDGPFVAINCAAIPADLLESELFGHEKGAFTGATAQRKGQIEIAQCGTLLLDEIGELALPLQAKLLRVLQEREFTRVGGTRPIHADVRFLAATNRDLAVSSKAGAFRQDLYYRLNVISITLPPLRERREDILLLARYFAAKFGTKCNRPVAGISPEAEGYLTGYDWPGNIRELENAIEHAIVLGSTESIVPEDLPERIFETVPASPVRAAPQSSPMDTVPTLPGNSTTYQTAVVDLKKELILNAVREADGNYTEAAKHLRVSPNYLHRLIRNLNIKSLIESEAP